MTDIAPEIYVLGADRLPETAQLVSGLLEQAEGLKVHTSAPRAGKRLPPWRATGSQIIVLADTLEHLAGHRRLPGRDGAGDPAAGDLV